MNSINILCVEDSPAKARVVEDVLTQIVGIGTGNIDYAQDLVSAKRLLAQKAYDLAIVDIQFPTRFGSAPERLAGIRLLEEIDSNRTLNRPSYIIGLTEFDDCIESANEFFNSRTFDVVRYSIESSDWRNQLTYLVRHVQRAVDLAETSTKNIALAIVCALRSPELSAVLSLPIEWKRCENTSDCIEVYEGTIESSSGLHTVICASAMEPGMAASASLCTMLVERYRPRILAMTGIAGGIEGESNFGDIVVADVVWDYTSGKYIEEDDKKIRFLAEPRTIDADALIKSQMLRTATSEVLKEIKARYSKKRPDVDLKAHFGPMFCGNAVVATKDMVRSLSDMNRKIRAIDMESYSVFCSAKYSARPEPLVIVAKSISDHANAAKNDDWHEYASYTSASLLCEWAKRFL